MSGYYGPPIVLPRCKHGAQAYEVCYDCRDERERERRAEEQTLVTLTGYVVPVGGLQLFQDAWLPKGAISPCWESDPCKAPPFYLRVAELPSDRQVKP